MTAQPASLNGLIALAFQQASNPPPFFPPEASDGPGRSRTDGGSSSTAADAAQDPALITLSIVERASQLANSLSVISENESLRDISTSSLRVLFLDSLRAELELQVRTSRDFSARKQRIRSSLASSVRFLSRVVELNVLPASTKSLIQQQLASARLPAAETLSGDGAQGSLDNLQLPAGAQMMPPRDLKIALFKLERALKQSLDQFRTEFAAAKLSQRGIEKQPADPFFDLLLFVSSEDMKSSSGAAPKDADEDEDEDESSTTDGAPVSSDSQPRDVRQYLLLLLNLHAVRAASSGQSSAQELELLNSMPPPPPEAEARLQDEQRAREDAEWRLDSSLRAGKGWSGPLLDDRGKPMRPFTITSSSAGGDRQKLKDEVFRPSHRLPTMSIDEYLEEERRRGNIIEGGGPEGAAKATPREARALRAENDGTLEAQEAEEEARQEALYWDEFKEANKRGAGNTMNRG